MQIIVVDKRLSRARTLTLSPRMFMVAVAGLAMAVLFSVIGLFVSFHTTSRRSTASP